MTVKLAAITNVLTVNLEYTRFRFGSDSVITIRVRFGSGYYVGSVRFEFFSFVRIQGSRFVSLKKRVLVRFISFGFGSIAIYNFIFYLYFILHCVLYELSTKIAVCLTFS